MTHALASTIRHYYHTVDTAGHEAVVALFHPDAVYRRPGYPPLEGRDALLAFYGGVRVIASGRHELQELLVDAPAGRAAVAGRFLGHLKDGTAVTVGFADFFHVRDGLITDRTTYFDRAAV
jgi:ketosteroid isomerase-like protein